MGGWEEEVLWRPLSRRASAGSTLIELLVVCAATPAHAMSHRSPYLPGRADSQGRVAE